MREFIYTAPQMVVNIISLFAGLAGIGFSVFSFRKDEKENNKPSKSFWTSLIAPILIAVLYILFNYLKDNLIKVPDLHGWSYSNAIQTLNERSISYELVPCDFDAKTAKITYQSFNGNDLIFSWEKLVLNVDNLNVNGGGDTSGTTNVSSPDASSPIIEDEGETSETINVSSPDASSPNTTEEVDSGKQYTKLPIKDYFAPEICAMLDGTTLNIEVSKSLEVFKEADNRYPFKWGIYLSDSIEQKVNDYVIEVEVTIDKTYAVLGVELSVMLTKENSNYMVEQLRNEFSGYFDGDKFILSGDISNDYIGLSDLCVQTVYFVDQ